MVTTVLVIEDEPALSRLISWALLDAGFEVAIVPDGAAALERVRTYHPDVIIFNTIIDPAEKHAFMQALRDLTPKSRILDVSEEKNLRARGMIQSRESDNIADAALDIPLPADRLIDAINGLLPAAH